MRIREVSISGYKSLKDISMQNLSDLVVLIGENGSGKTNLIEAIDFFFSSINDKSSEESEYQKLSPNLWHRKNTSSNIGFSFRFEFEDSEVRKILGDILYESISKKVRNAIRKVIVDRYLNHRRGWKNRSIIIGKTHVIEEGKTKSFDSILSGLNARLPYSITELTVSKENEPVEMKYILHQGRGQNAYLVPHETIKELVGKGILKQTKTTTDDFDEWLTKSGIETIDIVEQGDDIGIPNSTTIVDGIMSVLFKSYKVMIPASLTQQDRMLLEEELLEETRRVALSGEYNDEEEWTELRRDFEAVYRGSLTTKGEEVVAEEEGRSYPIDSLGSGHQSWLRLLRQFRHRGGVIAIEEPESHLHPSLCRHVSSYMKVLSHNTQIILTTHSPLFVDREAKESNWVVEIDSGESRIYQFKNFVKALDSVGAKPSDRFMPESILLVEGESDKAFFEACAKKLKLNMDELYIVPVHGKTKVRRNLDAWAPISLGTQVKLHILLDRDALCVVQDLVRRGILNETDYSLLPSELEDLYPRDLLVSTMKKAFGVNIDAMDPLSPPRKEYLKNKISEQGEIPKKWNVTLAEEIGEKIPKADIPVEIVSLIKSMKSPE